MSRVTLAFPVDALQGKVNKQDTAYFAKRNGKCFMNRIINPFTGAATTNQLEVQTKFTKVTKLVSAIIAGGPGNDSYDQYKAGYDSNPGKADSLRGYIFIKEWEKA